MQQFIVSNSGTEEDLEEIAAFANILTKQGMHIQAKVATILETEDPRAIEILDRLFSPKMLPQEFSTAKAKELKKKPRSKQVPGDHIEGNHIVLDSHSWEVLNENKKIIEALTIEDKNQRLADGKFEPGACLRYKRNGLYFTVVGAAHGKPQKLARRNQND